MNERSYLARLVERVAPTEPLLRRRQPALFEGASAAAMTALPHVADETPVSATAPQLAAPAAMAPLPAPMTAELPAPRTPARRTPDVPQAPAARAAPAEVRLPSEPPRVDHTLRTVTVQAAPPPATVAREPAAAVRPAATPKPARDPVVIDRVTHVRHEPARPAPRAAEPAKVGAPERPARQPAPQVQAVVQRAVTPPAAATPAVRPARAATPPQSPVLRRAATPAAPTAQPAPRARELPPIDITIGRIEVRAVPAPSQPRRSAAAPKLGLEQYLNEREGGR